MSNPTMPGTRANEGLRRFTYGAATRKPRRPIKDGVMETDRDLCVALLRKLSS